MIARGDFADARAVYRRSLRADGLHRTLTKPRGAGSRRNTALDSSAITKGVRHRLVDYVDVCTFPDFRSNPSRSAPSRQARAGAKPISTNLENRAAHDRNRTRRRSCWASSASTASMTPACSSPTLAAGRLGKLLELDGYTKWYRSAEIYARPIKGAGGPKAAAR